MKAESPTPQADLDPTHSGQLIQFPETEGVVPLGNIYSSPGSKVVWELHPFTRTDTEAQTTNRQAIIHTETGNTYYLYGDALFDIAGSIRSGKVALHRLSDTTAPIPDVTIGEPTAFSGGAKVSEVIIATGQLDTTDSDTADALRQAWPFYRNPFMDAEATLETVVAKMQHGASSGYIDMRGLQHDEDRPIYGQTFRYIDPQFGNISNRTRSSREPYGDIGRPVRLGVSNQSEEELEIERTEPFLTSRKGVPISPQAPVKINRDETTGNIKSVERQAEYKTYLWRRAGKASVIGAARGGKAAGRVAAAGGRTAGRGIAKGGRKSAEVGIGVAKETGRVSAKAGKVAGRIAVKGSLKAAEATATGYTKLRERGERRFEPHEPVPLVKRIK